MNHIPVVHAARVAAVLLAVTGCEKRELNEAPTSAPVSAELRQAAPTETSSEQSKNGESARLGQPAPAFTLDDLDGKPVRLADFKGRTVVLEWFNPQCPFVKLSHTKGSLKGLAERYADKGVVWLAINSAAEGRQGHGAEKNRQAAKEFKMHYPVLLDESGQVGRAYAATNTPHLFVIDPQGVLVYQGAIDNSPDGEGESPTGGELVNYVAQALDELSAGKPITVASTKAYGCGVKYGD